jgi:hypothetical protein
MEDLSLEVEESEHEPELHPAEPVQPETADPEATEPPKPSQVFGFTESLEKSGALEMLAEALVTLYTTPKTTPELFNFFLQAVGSTESPDVDKLLLENQELRKAIANLKQQISALETRVRK